MISETATPRIGHHVYIAPTAYVGGRVTLGDECVILYHVVIRGDVSDIRIGRRVNVQDGAVVHTQTGVPLEIEDEVSIGHRAVVHGRRIGRRALIGIGSIVLDGAVVGEHGVVAAGAVVPPGMEVPPGKVVMGVPARIVRDVTAAEREYAAEVVRRYVELAREHRAGRYPAAIPNICPTGANPEPAS